ncbi:hypothetical protein [Streptomyces sp. NPDC002516]
MKWTRWCEFSDRGIGGDDRKRKGKREWKGGPVRESGEVRG